MLSIGIDVGFRGGIAFLGDKEQTVYTMPIIATDQQKILDLKKIVALIQQTIEIENVDKKNILYVIEEQQAMPKQGVCSMFQLGKSYGMLLAIPLLLNIPYISIKSRIWKKEILAGTTKDKLAAINYVIGKYPNLNIDVGIRTVIYHDGMADAVCIAEYGRKILKQQQ